MNTQWKKIAANLEKMLDSGIYRVWVSPLHGMIDSGQVHVFAPNAFMADWVKKHLLEKIRQAASPVLEMAPERIIVDVFKKEETVHSVPVSGAEIVAKLLAEPEQRGQQRKELPLPGGNYSVSANWRFSFEDFVTGSSNNVAAAAAHDMCEKGQIRTLFVTASPGLGKTHLAHAAGQAISRSSTPLKIGYLTGEQFASNFVRAMRSHELEDFKQHLCALDMLLLEDVHFLQRKMAMQEMLLGIIKNLQEKGSRVIFTSSFAPRQLRDIDSQLVSYFCSGILTRMEKPDQAMRKEILQRKAKFFQVRLPDEVCNYLSNHLSSDVRQLEACLKNMVFKARLLHSGIDIQMAMETASQFADAENRLDMPTIVKLVCESFGLTELQLRSRSRRQELVQGRNTVFYLARKHTEMSLEQIGCIFNRRHSTVLRSVTQVEEELAANSSSGRQLARAISLIERKYGLDVQN